MGTQRLQHYVPKCMLRRFSAYPEAKAIDLFNISASRRIMGASLRYQCARNYLYGENLELENALAQLEGAYSQLVVRIVGQGHVGDDDIESLRFFVHIQRARTSSAAARLAAVRSDFFDLIEKHMPHLSEADLSTKTIMRESMAAAMGTFHSVKDLAFAILVNTTKTGFFTSDNPVSVPNRFLSERNGAGNYGLGSSGVALFMPLAPSHAVFFYDRDVYRVDKGLNHRVELKRRADIERLNFMTFCFADQNVYFDGSHAETDFESLVRAAAPFRHQYRHIFGMLRLVEHTDGKAVYRSVGREEFEQPGEGMIVQSQYYPVFALYPVIFRARREPKFIDTGTGAGILRPALYNQ